jgi:hypothetical protein
MILLQAVFWIIIAIVATPVAIFVVVMLYSLIAFVVAAICECIISIFGAKKRDK